MSKTNYKEYETMMTPPGVASWAHVHKPNQFFNYGIDLVLTDAQIKELYAPIKPIMQEFYTATLKSLGVAKVNALPLPWAEDKDTKGSYKIKFKQKSKIVNLTKNTIRQVPPIPVVDSQGVLIKDNVGNGSIVIVAFEPAPYYVPPGKKDADGKPMAAGVGLSLRLKGVQVIELVEYDENAPKSGDVVTKFKPIAGGYTAKPANETTTNDITQYSDDAATTQAEGETGDNPFGSDNEVPF